MQVMAWPFRRLKRGTKVKKERNLPGVESMIPGGKQEKNLEWQVRGFIKLTNALDVRDGNGE